VVNDWRWEFNNVRPHRSLGRATPVEYEKLKTEATEVA